MAALGAWIGYRRVRGGAARGRACSCGGNRRDAGRRRTTALAERGGGCGATARAGRLGRRRASPGRGIRRSTGREQAGCARVCHRRCARVIRLAGRHDVARVVLRTRRLGSRMTRGESGAGTLLAISIVGAMAAIVLMTLPLYMGLSSRESVARAADASALAGADVAAGLSPGIPCAVARSVAAANRATLASCRVDGLVVTVATAATFLGMRLTASAAAGPPGAVSGVESK
jgi:secretion/DNA translocation related TadE-like protein